MPAHTLIRTDTRAIDNEQNEIRAFMTVRNEILRLPRTFEHYRNIGVARFFIVDNGSTDGSKEFLLKQPDCHLFVTHNSYAESQYGVEWQNTLLDEYGLNHWCLLVDADEWFIYPGYETISLGEFTAYLDGTGAQGVFSVMLDMYAPGPIAEAIAAPHRSLLDACRYFDNQYTWHRRLRVPGRHRFRFPEYNISGGPRWRLLFPSLHRHYYVLKTIWQISYYLGFTLPVTLRPAPILTKIPLVRWLAGTKYRHPHATTPIKLSDVTGVLLHFKFLEDFFDRVSTEVNRKEHFDGASEHARYLAMLKRHPSLSFHYAGSVEYEGSEQLIRLGLLREDQGWKAKRHAGAVNNPSVFEEQQAQGISSEMRLIG